MSLVYSISQFHLEKLLLSWYENCEQILFFLILCCHELEVFLLHWIEQQPPSVFFSSILFPSSGSNPKSLSTDRSPFCEAILSSSSEESPPGFAAELWWWCCFRSIRSKDHSRIEMLQQEVVGLTFFDVFINCVYVLPLNFWMRKWSFFQECFWNVMVAFARQVLKLLNGLFFCEFQVGLEGLVLLLAR